MLALFILILLSTILMLTCLPNYPLQLLLTHVLVLLLLPLLLLYPAGGDEGSPGPGCCREGGVQHLHPGPDSGAGLQPVRPSPPVFWLLTASPRLHPNHYLIIGLKEVVIQRLMVEVRGGQLEGEELAQALQLRFLLVSQGG